MTTIKPFSSNILQQNRARKPQDIKPKTLSFGWKASVETICSCSNSTRLGLEKLTPEAAAQTIKRAFANISKFTGKLPDESLNKGIAGDKYLSGEGNSLYVTVIDRPAPDPRVYHPAHGPMPRCSHIQTGFNFENDTVRYIEGFGPHSEESRETIKNARQSHGSGAQFELHSVERHYTLEPETHKERRIFNDLRTAVERLNKKDKK